MPAAVVGAGVMAGCVGAGMYVAAGVCVGDGVAMAGAFDDASGVAIEVALGVASAGAGAGAAAEAKEVGHEQMHCTTHPLKVSKSAAYLVPPDPIISKHAL